MKYVCPLCHGTEGMEESKQVNNVFRCTHEGRHHLFMLRPGSFEGKGDHHFSGISPEDIKSKAFPAEEIPDSE